MNPYASAPAATQLWVLCTSGGTCLSNDDLLRWVGSPVGQVAISLALIITALLFSMRLFAQKETV